MSQTSTLASGVSAYIRYALEGQTRNQVPAAIDTPTANIAAVADGGVAGLSKFTRATGSFLTDGFQADQWVKTLGFSNAENNSKWRVQYVDATNLFVYDANDDIVDEAAATGQTVAILMVKLRATGKQVNLEKNILESSEVDEDGQESDARHGFNRVIGAPGVQISSKDFNDWLMMLLQNSWYDVVVTGGPNFSVTGGNTFTRSAGSYITDGFRPGDIIRSSGFSNTENNRDSRVTAVTALGLTVDAALTNEGAGAYSITLPGRRLDLGTQLCTMIIEAGMADVGRYRVFKGVGIDQGQINVNPEAIIGGTFNLLGMSADAMSTTQLGASVADTKQSDGDSPYAAFDGGLYEGGSLQTVVTRADFTVSRNLSLNPVVGSKTSPDLFRGTARIALNLAMFFQDETIFNKFVNETESSLWLKFQDPASSLTFMNVVFPRTKYNGAAIDPPQEGPIVMEMPCRALKATGLAYPGGTTVNTMMSIQRSDAD